ncbi:hypothetical protein N9878_01185 [bacterium]|nr:hypothetical protein [bacterium]
MNGLGDEYGQLLKAKQDDRIQDAQIERQKHENQWDINVALYHGEHQNVFNNREGDFYATSNQIQGAVITQVAVMTERPIRPIFVGRETNEPPEIFIKPESAFKVPPNTGLSQEQLAGAEVIPEPLFDFLSAQTMPQTVDNPRAGEVVPGTGMGESKPEVQPDTVEIEVPVFDDDDFHFVDDALCAEALTQEHDSEWEMCSGDEMLRQAITQASVVGHQDFLVQWNAHESRFDLVSLYPYHTWIDRWSFSTRDAEYYVIRRIVSVAEAEKEYPGQKDEIQANKTSPTDTGWWGGASGNKFNNISDREVVEVFTTWERNHPYPMATDPAPEPVVEPEPVVDEVDEVEDESKELPVDDAPQSDPKPDRSDLIDKEVQRLQQLRATYEREISKLGEAPTERQVERVEKAKTKLDKYLESADVDPYQGVADIASEVMADRGKVEQLLQQFEAERHAAEEREIRHEAEMAEMRFTMDYPDLKGQYRQIAQKANEALYEQIGDDVADLTPQAYVKLVNREFLRIAKDAVQVSKPVAEKAKKPITDTAKKPKAATIVSNKNGSKSEAPKTSEAVGESLIADLSKEFFGA